MPEKRKGTPIEKWDEVNGCSADVKPMMPDISRVTDGKNLSERLGNQMRSIEDAVEQNDNSLDGIINNLPQPEEAEKSRESVLKKLKEQEKTSGDEREKLVRIYCQAKELERDV